MAGRAVVADNISAVGLDIWATINPHVVGRERLQALPPNRRDYLFGRIALLADIADQPALDRALSNLSSNPSKSLADFLVESGAMSVGDKIALEHLLERHLAKHGDDPQANISSLVSFSTQVNSPLPLADTISFVPAATVATRPQRSFGDYELLGEIARGGMGVVYKARQAKLNRLVALKMIRSGELADDEQVKRFYAEAEAAAKLDHPGIVPVYEVGEANGQHFFSMALIVGTSLNEQVKNNGPLPPKDAARLLKLVVEAVEYAHGKGIIHRDIKPQNILLDETGQPRLTDFGLAKQVMGQSELTATGQIMGTPSYMPPEQASGKLNEIGPASDVYSLGATLYFVLIGRPPFQAASMAETIQQVLNSEPVALRKLNPALPRDLETICLKCLRKEPAKRYATALEFAADLGRWLENKPILARPVGPSERAWLWCKRRPTLVGLSLVFLVLSVVGTVTGTLIALERQNATRAQGLVAELENADIALVPGIVEKLNDYRDWAGPLLSQKLHDAKDGSNQKLHTSMALLPVDETQAAYLLGQLPVVSPSQFPVVRDALRPHREQLVEPLWKIALDEKQPIPPRFQAACALSTYAPADKRWDKINQLVAGHLVTRQASDLVAWREALRPAKNQLLKPLGIIYRDTTQREQPRVYAAETLADYSAEDPNLLAELIMDADKDQFDIIYSKFEKHGERGISIVSRELERNLVWDDPPRDPRWSDPDSVLVSMIEKANGVVAERFAFTQTMLLKDFLVVAESLRKSGYRPVRFRPYADGRVILVAAVWKRDGLDWKIAHAMDKEEMSGRNNEHQKNGYAPEDLAGYWHDGLRYAAIWTVNSPATEGRQILIGIPHSEHQSHFDRLFKAGLVPITIQVAAAEGLHQVRSQIYGIVPSASFEQRTLLREASFVTFARASPLSDVSISDCEAGQVFYGAIRQEDKAHTCEELHGLNETEHLARSRLLIAAGYRPVAISVRSSEMSKARITVSAWHRPIVSEDDKEHLAKRQAKAAVALVRLGAAEQAWPLLKHTPDPRVRTYFIHWLSTLGGDPKAVIKRLDSEPDVSIRRALLLMLGEFNETQLSIADRQPLAAKLLALYETEPDAGLHAAAEWLLRHWGEEKQLHAVVEKLKANQQQRSGTQAGEKRNWYVNSQGQTMVIVEAGDFQMGSPTTEPGRANAEVQHRRKIERRFAMATHEVTKAQFAAFQAERPEIYEPEIAQSVKAARLPQDSISWYEAAEYCNWLSAKDGIAEDQWCYEPNAQKHYAAGMKTSLRAGELLGYRLPSEAEWEYACRAGSVTSRYYGSSEPLLPKYAWHLANSNELIWPVGSLKPNDWGLFDMLGSVYEWTNYPRVDYPDSSQQALGKVVDSLDEAPVADNQIRVVRGGFFESLASHLGSARRESTELGDSPRGFGFRVARTLPPVPLTPLPPPAEGGR